VNWIDIAIIATVLWFTLSAFHAGFIREVVTLVAVFIGVVVAGLFYEDLAQDVLLFIENDTLASIVAFMLVFGGIALAGQMLALVLKPAAHMFQLGIFDQLMGAAFGLGKAMMLVAVFIVVFITYPRWGIEEAIDESLFGSLIAENVTIVTKVLPTEFETAVERFGAEA
jgi:membrane protein required for colicin V production